MRIRLRDRQVLRRRIIIVSSIITISALVLVFLNFFNNKKASAAVTGDIRSIASGNWNNLAIWEKYNGTSWIPAIAIPSSTDKQIVIKSGHTVTITAALSVDEVVVESGAVLSLNSGITLTLKKLAIPDLAVYGIFRNAGLLSIAGGTSITYYSGGRYQHNYTTTAGTIPVGVWLPGSVCEIMGYTTNIAMPTGLNQTFTDLEWNCINQTVAVNFAGGMTSFNGNFIVNSTGSSSLQMATSNYTLSMTGDMVFNGGTTIFQTGASKTFTINQTGNIYMAGGTLILSNANNATGNHNLNGHYFHTNGTFNFASGNSGTSSLNIKGNWSHSGGTLTTTGSGATGQVVFNNSINQYFSYSPGGVVNGNVDYTINNGAILNMGTSYAVGRNFTVSPGGKIGIGSTDGISSSGTTGNIQVTGTRTFNTAATYSYNGSGSQYTGNGLPSTVANLEINNAGFVLLTNTVAVSTNLNLLSGIIYTGALEINVTNTSATAITNAGNTSFVCGNVRRTLSASSTFDFPVGSIVYFEPMSVTTASLTGATSMVCCFTQEVMNDTNTTYSISVNGVDISEMLTAGYWTVTPNAPITAGSYAVSLNEQGYINIISSHTFISALSRTNSSSAWMSVGTQIDSMQHLNGSIVTAVRSGLTAGYQYCIGLGQVLSFSSPVLYSGTAGTIGAIYIFPGVLRNVDAWIEIINIYNGAVLSDIDNSTGGYSESFQPFVTYPPEKDSYIEWRIRFKVSDTSTDTTIKKITATGVDVDGAYNDANNNLREYVVATMPTSYSLDASTTLTMVNDSGRYKAIGSTVGISNIDTSEHQAMYQLNYNNVNSLLYRTGAINNYSSSQTRQTSLYFRSFLTGASIYALPVTLTSFSARKNDNKVELNWTTASEINNDFFSVERSENAIDFDVLGNVKGAGTTTIIHDYSYNDNSPPAKTIYYRLKQTDYDGKFEYTDIISVNMKNSNSKEPLNIISIYNDYDNSKTGLIINSQLKSQAQIILYDYTGQLVDEQNTSLHEGLNQLSINYKNSISSGIYILVVNAGDVKTSRKFFME
jgi:hypothetical protein